MSPVAAAYTRALGGKGVVTTEAVIEGRSGDIYGGWGFFFVRRYLADTHAPGHTDDPMSGYQESISGTNLPPLPIPSSTSSSGVTVRLQVAQAFGIVMRVLQGLCKLFRLMRDSRAAQ